MIPPPPLLTAAIIIAVGQPAGIPGSHVPGAPCGAFQVNVVVPAITCVKLPQTPMSSVLKLSINKPYPLFCNALPPAWFATNGDANAQIHDELVGDTEIDGVAL